MSTNTKDFGGIIKQVYDPASESLQVSLVGSGSPTIPNVVRLSDGTGYLSSTVGGGYRALDVVIKDMPNLIISHTDDSIRIGDGVNLITSTTSGSKIGLDVNIINSLLSAGTENGTDIGVKHVLKVDSDLDLHVGISNGTNKAAVDITGKLSVKDIDSLASLNSILTQLNSGVMKVDDDATQILLTSTNSALASILTQLTSGTTSVNDASTQSILTNILTFLNSGILKVDDDATQALLVTTNTTLSNIVTQLQSGNMSIGTENGTPTGTQHVFVNNLRQMIMAAQDRVSIITWLDISDKRNRRVDKIEFTSATFPTLTVRKQFSYTLVGTEYIRTSSGTYSIV